MKLDGELKKFEHEIMNQATDTVLQDESATKDIKKLSNIFFIVERKCLIFL